jgi:hypothetical protein
VVSYFLGKRYNKCLKTTNSSPSSRACLSLWANFVSLYQVIWVYFLRRNSLWENSKIRMMSRGSLISEQAASTFGTTKVRGKALKTKRLWSKEIHI